MKTNELIAALAADSAPVQAAEVARRFYLKLAGGAVLAIAAVLLLMGARADLAHASLQPMFWVKLFFPASLAAAALVGLRRLSHPGMRLGQVPAAIALAVIALWLMAALVMLASPSDERLPLVLGQSWLECLTSITLLAAPALGLAFWAARELAPTRLSLAGTAAGLFAGAVAAFAYAIHCPEIQAPFLAVWYVLGMSIPTAAGALLGPRLLHW